MSGVDERALADQIEAMKDDPEAWGDSVESAGAGGPKRRSERRQRGAVVSVRLTPDELAKLQKYAHDRGLSLSGALRAAGIEAAEADDRRSTERPQRWSRATLTTAQNMNNLGSAPEVDSESNANLISLPAAAS